MNPKAFVRDDLKRRSAKRLPNKRIHVVCEGAVTELRYLNDFVRSLEHKVAVPGIVEGGAGVPKSIIERCIQIKENAKREAKRNGYPNLDEVWAVFDVDEHDLQDAVQLAKTHSIKCAISNPCIEIWGLLHQSEVDRPYHRHEAQRALSSVIPNYHHDKCPVFEWSWCYSRTENATRNAVRGRMNRYKEGSCFPGDIPSTNVDRLLASFDPRLLEICSAPTWSEWPLPDQSANHARK